MSSSSLRGKRESCFIGWTGEWPKTFKNFTISPAFGRGANYGPPGRVRIESHQETETLTACPQRLALLRQSMMSENREQLLAG